MDNLWILTEEKPKISVIKQIVTLYKDDFNQNIRITSDIKIKPIIQNNTFRFKYEIQGIEIENIQKIIIKTVSGSSSFIDFLVFKQNDEPIYSLNENLIMAIEETKTNDSESRNTGVYQRSSKFVYIDAYYKNVKLYMLYNKELEDEKDKKPSDTNIFGTNMLLTIGVKVIGKDVSKWFHKFNSITEMIEFKSKMKKPPQGNIPITIKVIDEKNIEVSGRLSKPADEGNIGHDPNIGALSIISKTLRFLGWKEKITITRHGVSQNFINRTKGKNKFLYICKILNLHLENIEIPFVASLPETYWHYDNSSEKIASILLHIAGEYNGLKEVYQNHAGCERGYFKTKTIPPIALPKKDKNDIILNIPDLILYDEKSNEIILVEGKKLSTLRKGLEEIQYYDSIEKEFINVYYPGSTTIRWLSIFGGNLNDIPHKKVILYLNSNGKIFINKSAPDSIKQAFNILNS